MRIKPGQPGSIQLYSSLDKNEHAQIGHHYANEQWRKVKKPTGIVEEWVKTGQNHLLDCGAMALGAGKNAGYCVNPEAAGNRGKTTQWRAPKRRKHRGKR